MLRRLSTPCALRSILRSCFRRAADPESPRERIGSNSRPLDLVVRSRRESLPFVDQADYRGDTGLLISLHIHMSGLKNT